MTLIEQFKTLCGIPHCSADSAQMKAYLVRESAASGYEVQTDDAGNILCTHPDANVTLQAHYDMVCIGRAPVIETEEKDEWLSADDATLGSDNGMGMAMMLCLMREGAAVDCLFTADEEVGLIGARALALPLKTPYLLNLDSEAYGEIMIGCAGGVDLNVSLPLRHFTAQRYCYEVSVEGLPGGHSGVDIDRGIPNAIKELCAALHEHDLRLVALKGGERRNAIAKKAVAVVASETPIECDDFHYIGHQKCRCIENGITAMLHGFAHGVRSYDTALGIVDTSINLAQAETMAKTLEIKLSARAMHEDALLRLESETRAYFESFEATVVSEGFYPPWEPEQNAFVALVRSAYERVSAAPVRIGAIHAGLECGIIKEHAPGMQMASVGPTILFPHSTRERVDVKSAEAVFDVVRAVIASAL